MAQLPLTPTQQASVNLSMTWKRSCKQLFDLAKTLQEFSDAVYWCGKAANVLRTIPKAEFPAFANWLYIHLADIQNGTFVYDVRIPISGVSTYPRSFIAKICHIINPHAYPLIWDSHVVEHLKNQNTTWNQAVNAAKAQFQNAPDDDIYRYDSILWA
ncbi:MAG: hypothetical protein ACI392_02820 [Paludibacteraceae bacterium]